MSISADSGRPVVCANCGTALGADDRFCPECGAERPAEGSSSRIGPAPPPEFASTFTTPATLGAFTGAPPFVGMALAPVGAEDGSPLLQYEVEYPERLSRLLIFVKWLLAIPHYVVLYILGILFSFVTFIAWFAILLTGRYPRSLWDFSLSYYRWSANVAAYLTLQRDEYPPFSGSESYPVRFAVEYPARLSRVLIFIKWLLVIPNVLVYAFVLIAAWLVLFLAWFAILATGRYPRGLFDFVSGTLRWGHRLNLYVNLMTDRYPPFRTGP